MKTLTLALIGVLFHFSAHAIYLKGFVYDDISEKAVVDATIQLKYGKKVLNETTSSLNGSFLLDLKKGKSYTIFVNKLGYETYSIIVDANRESIPLMEVFLSPMTPKINGVLVDGKEKPLSHREIKCINLKTDQIEHTMTDEKGNFFFEIEVNNSYRFYFKDSQEKYSDASIFISTVGANAGLKINRRLVTTLISSVVQDEKENEWEVINTDSDQLMKYSTDKSEGEVVELRNKFNDSVYVVNKHVPLISFNKRKQKRREKEIETIYFYAQLVEDESSFSQHDIIAEEDIKIKIPDTKIEITEEPEPPIPPKPPVVKTKKIIEIEDSEKEEIAEEKKVVIKKIEKKIEDAPPSVVEVEEEKELLQKERVTRPKKIVINQEENPRKVIINKSSGETIILDPSKEATDEIVVENVKKPSPAVLAPAKNTVYFAKGKSFLTDEAMSYLNQFATMLVKNPKMSLTISSHTDSDIEYTIEKHLARLRAESVMSYLLEKGVLFDQLTIRSMGNRKPVNKCAYGVECTEDEHKMNRRVHLTYDQSKPY